MRKSEEMERKISDWREMNQSYLQEIKSLVNKLRTDKRLQIISYFTYSLNVFHDADHANFVIGSYHIQNVGGVALTNPHICIKISPDSPFDFSGKFQYKDSKQKINLTNAWERINDRVDKEEFWLKPNGKSTLGPSESLIFSNFQVQWLPEASYVGSIMGYTYGNEMKEGLSALNQINISGTLTGGDENNEQL